jgi:hypothetical protein
VVAIFKISGVSRQRRKQLQRGRLKETFDIALSTDADMNL